MVHERSDKVKIDKDEWRTPLPLYRQLDREFHFDLDAACTAENCLSRNNYGYTKTDNALKQDWKHFMMDNGEYAATFWLNPPFSKGGSLGFTTKALEETTSCSWLTVVCLLPVDFSTPWWHNNVMQAAEIRAIRGRVKYGMFVDGVDLSYGSPTFSSCIAIFKQHTGPVRFVSMEQEKK